MRSLRAEVVFHPMDREWGINWRDEKDEMKMDFFVADFRQMENSAQIRCYQEGTFVCDFEHDRSILAMVEVAVPQVGIDHWGRSFIRGFTTDVRRHPDGKIPLEHNDDGTVAECGTCTGETARHPFGPYLPPIDNRLILQPVTIRLHIVETP